jgi:VanZ family protein
MLKWSKGWARWYRRALPAYWIFLFCATHFPKAKLPGRIPKEDKLVHFVAFGLLAFLLWRCAESFGRKLSGRFVWMAFGGLGIYAAADEYLQGLPGINRSVSLLDWLADLAGIAAVLIAFEVRRRLAAQPPLAERHDPQT